MVIDMIGVREKGQPQWIVFFGNLSAGNHGGFTTQRTQLDAGDAPHSCSQYPGPSTMIPGSQWAKTGVETAQTRKFHM